MWRRGGLESCRILPTSRRLARRRLRRLRRRPLGLKNRHFNLRIASRIAQIRHETETVWCCWRVDRTRRSKGRVQGLRKTSCDCRSSIGWPDCSGAMTAHTSTRHVDALVPDIAHDAVGVPPRGQGQLSACAYNSRSVIVRTNCCAATRSLHFCGLTQVIRHKARLLWRNACSIIRWLAALRRSRKML